MATSPNFSWPEPDNTDLVKNGALAIRTAVDAIDASMVDLKGGTTGQVLSKATNTDMDFTWVAQDDSNAIQNALLTTTGDTIYASGASTPARRAIGTTGQVLTVSGGVPVWATPAGGGGKILQVVTATYSTETDNSSATTWADSGLTLAITPSSASSKVLAMVSLNTAQNGVSTSAGVDIRLVRGSTTLATSVGVNYIGVAHYAISQWALDYLDSPATTSATTYKVQFKLFSGAGGAQISRVQANGSNSQIILMEVGA